MSESFIVEGGYPLRGEVTVQRSKNAVLPMIAAALLAPEGLTILHGVPEIADVMVALDIARAVGAQVTHDRAQHTVTIDASNLHTTIIPAELSQKIRSSVLFLAPLLARLGSVTLPGSGGCDIGVRKIDFHHRGFARLGAKVETDDRGTTHIDLGQARLQGALLYLDLPSHTGTENLMMGAALAEGQTIIENAAQEPEVVDFGHFLIRMGAKIQGLGTPTLFIEGVKRLHAVEYTPIPDRLVIGLLAMSAAITAGDVLIRGVEPSHLRLVNAKLEQMGVIIHAQADEMRVQRPPTERLAPINITTHPYPGFPTDLQPCISALSTIAEGKSYIRERIFENRYDFADGLIALGADILISQSDVCVINGVPRLRPSQVRCASIRAGAALLLASLAVHGQVTLSNIYQIDRGHEQIERQLEKLGARIRRVAEQSAVNPIFV
ncbi:MAG: UDP-N-acetylglucosamine 1-carboxyvinyltransferase [Anaerolineae bacterium]|nr:UDP-N-acetylglucosamine 1-carboxyvinyltransferase [Anaerolineae bacterium]MDW8173302.1 UDP-N-acetylglucosamine 1-carboxyvinyltransferase [Anaerolineae bacterium]